MIGFMPNADIFRSGNDPWRILRGLENLGTMTVETDLSRLPAFDVADAETCYLSWRIALETTAPRRRVHAEHRGGSRDDFRR